MRLRICLSIVVTMLALIWLYPSMASAQQAGSGKVEAASGKVESGVAAEAAKRQAVFASKAWQELKGEFHQWLSAQVVLTPQQVEQMKAKLDAEVKGMSAAELQEFTGQWNAKFKILQGKDAVEAREWLAQNLMVMADGYRKEFLQELGLTDITDMTAAQLEQKILAIRAKRISMRDQRAFFDATRQKEIEYAQKTHTEWRTEAQQAAKDAGSAAKFDSYQSQYSPAARNNNYPQRYRPAYGGPFGGFGWGAFW